MPNSEKWLIHMPNNPGDVVMALFVVDAWKSSRPQDELHFLVDAECVDLVSDHPQISAVFCTPRIDIIRSPNPLTAVQILENTVHALNQARYDGILNLYQGKEGSLFLALIQCNKRLGLQCDPSGIPIVRDPWSQYLFAIPANRSENQLHAIDIYLRIAHLAPIHRPRAQFPQRSFASPMGAIALQTGSAWPGKRWPTNHWKEFIKSLFQLFPQQALVFLGGPSEFESNQELCTLHPLATNLCGKSKLGDTPAILKRSKLLITGDTFAMHVASAVGCPVIAIFGPSNPVETGPYATGSLSLCPRQEFDSNLDFNDIRPISQILPKDVLEVLHGHTPNDLQLKEGYWSGVHTFHSHNEPQFFPKSTFIQPEIAVELRKAIEIAIETPNTNHFSRVETLEQELAVATSNCLQWEKYRIALASLDWRNPIDYLHSRLRLLSDYLS